MKNFQKQALAVISMIMLLATAACSLSPADNSVGNHESAPTQADGELFDSSEIIDFSELSLASEEISDEISEEFSEEVSKEISDEFSETSSDESIFESSSEEVSAVIEPLTEQETKIVLKVENGKDFEFEDTKEIDSYSSGPMAFFVDSDETIWLFDTARKRNALLAYKNGNLVETIIVPDFSSYLGILIYGDENNIYLVNESDNNFFNGKIWTINKQTHDITSEIYYECDRYNTDYKQYPRYFCTINGKIYLCVYSLKYGSTFYEKNEDEYIFYSIENGEIALCEEKMVRNHDKQRNTYYFKIPQNKSGTFTAPSNGERIDILSFTDDEWIILSNHNCFTIDKRIKTIIYKYSGRGKLLAAAYDLNSIDTYNIYIEQNISVSPNGKIYRLENIKGEEFTGTIVSEVLLGTRIPTAEELTEIGINYYSSRHASSTDISSDAEASS